MPVIKLTTIIDAPLELVFDLSRSIDLHLMSLKHTNEKAVAGRTTGLVKEGETVTWEAKHLGITQKLTSHITSVQPHSYFADEQSKGAFKSFTHEHHFKTLTEGVVEMKDVFNYKSPLGILGKLADVLFLKTYMTCLLSQRNSSLKKVAENGSWKQFPGMKKEYS